MFNKCTRAIVAVILVFSFGCGGEDSPGPAGPTPPSSVTLAPAKDNTLYEDAIGQWSNGVGSHMFIGATKAPGSGGQSGEPSELRRAVIAFDIAGSGIPAGSTIDSVRLVLNVSRMQPASTTMSVHKLSADWGEGTSSPLSPNEGGGAASTTNDATWIHRFYNTQQWTSPGGDFNPTASATTAISAVAKYTLASTAALVADVQGWLDTPANNFGWILIGDESTDGTATRLDTRHITLATSRPQLIVYYTGP